MINLLLIFLPMIAFIGSITTYQDYKTGKIRNKWVLLGLGYAIIANLVLYLMTIGKPDANLGYFIELASTTGIALVVGFIMWTIGLWTAGDAKLYTAYSALLPLSVYSWGHVKYFASFSILINTFVPFFCFYVILMLYKTTWKQKVHYFKQSLELRQLATLALFLFSFSWPLVWVFSVTNLPANFFTSIAILFFAIILFERVFGENLLYLMGGVAVLRIILDTSLTNPDVWIFLLISMFSFILLRFFILYMGFDYMTKFIDVKLLKPGMVPAQIVYKEGSKYKRKNILHFSMLSYLQESVKKRDYLFEPTAEGLTEEDVKKLHKLEHKLGFEHLRIYQTLSFAPYLFLGVLLTILFEGNIFISLLA